MPTHILIVEDEVKLAKLLVEYCQQESFVTHVIHAGNEVVPWLQEHQTDLILLDIMLPEKNGVDICREIRSFSQVPIIMQTARVDEIDRLLGLELGADDYVCKPYSPRELIARIKAVLRRVHTPDAQISELIQLNESALKITINGETLELTSVEFQLLKILFSHPGQIFSRERLIQNIYSDHRVVSDRTVDSHIKKLRKKIHAISPENDFIHSVYGAGYKFEP